MKTTLFALLITSFLLVPFSKSYSQAVNVNDSLALVDLYNSTDGAHWTNNSGWLNGPVKSWYGINVSSDRVDQLILENNNLQGTLQSSLGKLTHLWNFDLHNNSLAGSIPSSLGNLVNLITLDLRYNLLTGTIPSSIGKLTNLSMLGFASNQLSGLIPISVNSLPNLFDVFLDNNHFTGKAPSFPNATTINDIEASYNQFTGSLPNYPHIEKLSELYLDHNQLTGNIPQSYSNFSVTSNISINDNQLSGPIPASFSKLDAYIIFAMQNNHFTFDSLEYIIANSTHQYFTYAPQLNISISYTPQGAFGKLSVHGGGTLSNNTYQWFKNNSLFKTNVGDSTFVPDAEGVYSLKVNNSVVTNLQLVSDNITIVTACASAPVNTTTTNIQSTSAKVSWSASQGAIKYTVQFKPVGATIFSSVTTKTTTATLKNLLPNTQYVWKVRATCSLQNSAFTALNNFTSPPSFAGISQANSVSENPGTISIYPNPAKDVVRIKGLEFNSEAVITILDVQGRKIINAANSKTNEIDVKQLNAGTYFVRIEADKNVTTLKFVKE